MPISSFTRRHGVKLALLLALPIVLYLFVAEKWSWQPRAIKVGAGTIESLSFAADSKTLAVGFREWHGTRNDEIQIWNIKDQTIVRRLTLPLGRMGDTTKITPDGKIIAGIITPEAGNRAPSIVTFDTRTAKMLSHVRLILPQGYSYYWTDVFNGISFPPAWALSSDGKSGAVGLTKISSAILGGLSPTGKVILFDARTGKGQRTLITNDSSIYPMVCNISFSATGKSMVTRATDSGKLKFKLWNTQTGRLKAILKEYPAAFSPDDKLWVSDSDTATWHLCDTQTGSVVRTLKEHHAPFHGWPRLPVAFSPDGATLATGSNDGTVKLWRIK